jgi:hypothetical protein
MAAVARVLIGLAIAFVVLAALVIGAFFWLRQNTGGSTQRPGAERCVATAGDQSVAIDLDQAHYTSIITGLSVRRGLAARAATIAMATVYQETGIRNLDYGDRDSVGLFQQRPSQGWGTAKQIMDPYYSTGRFYDALVKVDGWRTGDITEVAQKVQVSAYPDAYRDHEGDARVLASVFTGNSPAGLTCLERRQTPGDPEALVAGLRKTIGRSEVEVTDRTVLVQADSAKQAWVQASFAVANSGRYGVSEVTVGDRVLRIDGTQLAAWGVSDDAVAKDEVRITLR